jgi:type I site-specific restriction-modification system R (restriction) subunit
MVLEIKRPRELTSIPAGFKRQIPWIRAEAMVLFFESKVLLKGRLAEAVRRLNPKLPESAVVEVVHVVTKPEHPSLVQNNRAFHRYLMDGVLEVA